MTAELPLRGAVWLTAAESRAVLAALAANGREARFVGGCVRDTLLDAAARPHDLDVATQELPESAASLLRGAGFRVLPTGLAHGTVTALGREHAYEVTTLRRDVATDGRHAEVAFTDDFVEDAARRDFTINAMSCDAAGRLYDPFGGRADLGRGLIRFVGDPVRRIREDYLRILRWFRFFARFGREPPEEAALAACAAESPGIDILSGERLRAELLALLTLPRSPRAVELMAATGVLGRVVPAPVEVSALGRLLAVVGAGDPILALAAMLRPSDSSAVTRVATRLRLSRAEAVRLRQLVQVALPTAAASEALHRRGLEALGRPYLDLLRLAAAEQGFGRPELAALMAGLETWATPSLPVDGDDLLAAGVVPGPEVGRLLMALRRWWRDEDFSPDRAACLARLDALRRGGEHPPFP
jgi:poly(A) polymerase